MYPITPLVPLWPKGFSDNSFLDLTFSDLGLGLWTVQACQFSSTLHLNICAPCLGLESPNNLINNVVDKQSPYLFPENEPSRHPTDTAVYVFVTPY